MKIHDFARAGDIAGVAAELARGVEIDCLEISSERSALQCVCEMPEASLEMIRFLVRQGAQITPAVFRAAVQSGSMEAMTYLLEAGAAIEDVDENGYDILIYAAYGRCHLHEPSLIPVLKWLIENGAGVLGVSGYGEAALRIASIEGRFDAVQFLLDHGADPNLLGWTDLLHAIALGSLQEVKTLLEQGRPLDSRDHNHRTPWLLSLQVGDMAKAKLLLQAGADRNDRGNSGRTPLMIAIENDQEEMLAWLLAEGFDVNATNDFEDTPLLYATRRGNPADVQTLLKAGADPTKGTTYEKPIQAAWNVEVLEALLAAGEDLGDISDDMRRELTGVAFIGDLPVTPEEYETGRLRRFGASNPQRMNDPFWQAMVRNECSAYHARKTFSDTERYLPPVWCYQRFGRTITRLPDGRIVEIAGEHEDYYDEDFCIYNDVVVFDGQGAFEILGYPQELFPPTDFHTATLVGECIYIIGSLGYREDRRPGETPVFRLDCRTFQMERVATYGRPPGWIFKHKARYEASNSRICVFGGQIWNQETVPNTSCYAFSLPDHEWALVEP